MGLYAAVGGRGGTAAHANTFGGGGGGGGGIQPQHPRQGARDAKCVPKMGTKIYELLLEVTEGKVPSCLGHIKRQMCPCGGNLGCLSALGSLKSNTSTVRPIEERCMLDRGSQAWCKTGVPSNSMVARRVLAARASAVA